MVENELAVVLDFCELLQYEDGAYIKPAKSCEFSENTKGVVLIKSNLTLDETAVVEIEVDGNIIWTSNVMSAPKNINYIIEDTDLDLYITETLFIAANLVSESNIYSMGLKSNDVLVAKSDFKASLISAGEYAVEEYSEDHEVENDDESELNEIDEENVDINNSHVEEETTESTHEDYSYTIDETENENLYEHEEEVREEVDVEMSTYTNDDFKSDSDFSLSELISYKEILKEDLDKLIDKTKAIYDKNYFNIMSSPELKHNVAEIGELREDVKEKMDIILSFYKNPYDAIEQTIEHEKLVIAKKLLEQGLDRNTVANIVNINVNKLK